MAIKIPMYQQKTRAQAPTATGADFGSGAGQALAQGGDVLAQIGERIQTRNETINRVRTMNQFEQQVQEDFTALQQSEDISDPASIESFRSTIRERRESALSSFSGRPGTRDTFRAQLENMEGQYVKNAMGEQIKAQQVIMANMVDRESNMLSIAALEAPEQIGVVLSQFDEKLNDLSPALSEQQQQQYRANGRQKIASSAISGLLQRGQYDAAKLLMKDPTIASYLSPAEAQKIGLNIAVDESKAVKEQQRVAKNVASYTLALDRNLTAEEKIMVESFPDEKDMTLADKINRLEMFGGGTKEQIHKLAGAHIADGGADSEFGSSFKGRMFAKVNDGVNDFAVGQMALPQAQTWMMSVNELYSPYEKIDPETGLRTIVNPPVPSHIQRAMEQGEQFYGPVRQSSGFASSPGGQPGLFPGGAAEPSLEQVADQVRTGSERTIWERVPNVTGIGAGIARSASGMPVIGGELGIDPKYRSDAQFVTTSSRELIRALSINPRFPVAEMQAIEKEVNITPQTWTNEQAVQSDLVGIDEALEKRVKNYTSALSDKSISLEMRRGYMDAVVQIESFRETLGVPTVVRTPDEARKLPSGTQFRTPDGRILVTP